MMAESGFAYALARLHARLAVRMGEPDWQQLEASLDLAHALELAGRMPVVRVTRQLSRASGVHAIEAALRQALSDDIAEVAGWLPPRWLAVADWFAGLSDLRRRDFAAREAPRPEWFDESEEGWESAAVQWRSEWTKRIRAAGGAKGLDVALAPMLSRFLWSGGAGAVPAPILSWGALEAHFIKAFRTAGNGPVAVFAVLSLMLLDNERLRGLLVSRAVFAGGP
ncbi:hypothetical protein [Marimonas arenosa]|uniref:Uncharacterized protein n=1 Tax=Marimonas arenosa TaxID=1795305 RepID=A0AAE3WIN8_9RHOB|nr:hypothetical protein [Marimonas arenosa]MDQ2092188.1 hypothetical protein [Marimonas arenosa]